MKRYAFIFLMLITVCLLLSCGGGDELILTEKMEMFPDVSIDYSMAGTLEENRLKTADFFSNLGIRYRQETADSQLYLITGPVAEPVAKGDKKLRRTAYRVRLTETPGDSSCGVASITWIVESRGLKEDKWVVDKLDITYMPASLANIKKYFLANRCQRITQK